MMKSSIRTIEAKEAQMDTKKEAMPKKLLIDNTKWKREIIQTKKLKNKKIFYKKMALRIKNMAMAKLKKLSRNKHIGWINQNHKPRMVKKEKRNEPIFQSKLNLISVCIFI